MDSQRAVGIPYGTLIIKGLCQSAVLSGCSLLRYFLKEVTGQAGFPENTLHKSISKIAIDMN
jgi:hypothetical protein